jgi:hypothetical protein
MVLQTKVLRKGDTVLPCPGFEAGLAKQVNLMMSDERILSLLSRMRKLRNDAVGGTSSTEGAFIDLRTEFTRDELDYTRLLLTRVFATI